MASYGSLIFYKKNGVSDPFLLSYGKTTIGSSEEHHIRIKAEAQISCVLDSNEVGVTILVNENEHENILINNEPTGKYMILRNEDHLEIEKMKFKYSNPSLKEEHIKQAQETLNKKVGTMRKMNSKSEMDPPTPLKRLQKETLAAKHRRLSTGSTFATVKNSPRNVGEFLSSCRPTSTPQSPSRRFSRRKLARGNSTLASVMENEIFDSQNSKTTKSPLLATLESPSARKNKTFTGTSKFSSPIPAKNRTYSGNISDVSDSIITTPENNVTVDSITPLNISKKAKNSLNKSRTLSYVDFPNSSTPKSAIRMNRSSSLYKPLVEDITPASPLPRTSLRNSSLKKLAFMQRRSVNFNVSSSSDHSSRQASDSIGMLEESLTGSKRKRNNVTADLSALSGSLKKIKSSSSRMLYDNDLEDVNSLHDSTISRMQNTSNNDNSNDEPINISTSSNPKENIPSVYSENQSIVSWNLEVSSNDMNMSGLSELSSVAETPQRSKRLSKLNLSNNSVEKMDQSMENNMSVCSDLEEGQYSRRSMKNCSTSNLEPILVDTLNKTSENLKFSQPSKSRKYIRSKSLNLRRSSKKLISKHSKTLDDNFGLDISEENSLKNVSPTTTLQSSSTQICKTRTSGSKSLNMERNASNSLHVPSKASVSMNLNLSPVEIIPLINSSVDLKSLSSRSRRSSIRAHGKEKIRSKSLNLRTSTKKLLNEHSQTLGTNYTRDISQQESFKTEFKSMSSKRKSFISKENSKTVSMRNDNSVHVPSDTSSSMPLNISPIKSNYGTTDNDLNETDSFEYVQSTSTSSSVFINSMSEINDMNGLSTSSSIYNTGDSVTPGGSKRNNAKIPMVRLTRSSFSSKNIGSPTCSRLSCRSRSMAVSDNSLSNFSSVSSNISLCNSSKNDDDNSTNLDVFKTPNVKRAPRKLIETPNLFLKSTNDPTNIKPIEELLQENFEKSTRRSTRSSYSKEETDVDDKESVDTSLSKSSVESVESGCVESHEEMLGDNFSFDVSSNRTPRNIKNLAVQKSPQNDLTDVRGVKKLLKTPKAQTSPRNDLTDIKGVKTLLKTPKVQKSPRNDLSSVGGIKKLMKTPKVQKSPKNDLTNVAGMKKLMKTPKIQKSPKNDLTTVKGVKKLMKTPKARKSPENDLTNVGGVKKLMKTPKVRKSPRNDLTNVGGVKKLMKTPKVQKSPRNDLTNVGGVKKMMKTPKVQKSPRNDLTNVGGVKKLMKTPKIQKSPKNDLTNVAGVKKIMTIPKLQKSPKNDLTKVSGLKKLMASPKHQKSPYNDLSDVKGMKKILKTPRTQKSPKNDLLDVRGIKNLLRTPKNKAADDSHDLSGIDILFNESRESNFDKLLEKKPPRTYGRSPKLNSNQGQLNKPETPEHVLKWLEDQSNLEPVIQVENSKGKRKMASDASQETAVTPNKKPKITRSTRSNKDESIVNISSSIIGKPTSTPNGDKEKSNQQTSPDDKVIEQIGTRRAKRKLESNEDVDMEPILRRTRGRNRITKEEKYDGTNESEIKTLDNKTHKPRQAKQKNDTAEQLPKEVITRSRRGKTPKEINEDQITLDAIKKTENNQRKQTRNKKEIEKSSLMEEEIPEGIKNARRKRGKLQIEDIGNIVDTSSKRGKSYKQKETEPEISDVDNEAESKQTIRNNKQVEESVNNENMESIPRGRRKGIAKKEEKSIDIENAIEPKKRGRRKKKQDEKTTEIESEGKTNKEGTVDEDLDINKELTSHKKSRDNRKTESEQDKDDNEPIKKSTRRIKTNYLNPVDNDQPKPQPKKNTRSAKVEDPTLEETEITKTTRSNKGKNKKYNEEEWETPEKKQDKKPKVTFKDEVKSSQTPAESNTNVGRTLRKRRI